MSASRFAPRTVRMVLAGKPGGELRTAADLVRSSGAQVIQASGVAEALALIREKGGDLAMIDVRLDVVRFMTALTAERIAMPVIACGIDAPAEDAVAAIRAGARDYVPLPPDRELIAAALMSVAVQTGQLIGEAPGFVHAVRYATAMAKGSTALWLRGEAGTGKELLARHIHHMAGRDGPFVTIACDMADAELLASELFGHAANAFAGATAPRIGKLAEAARGTVLLRQVDALPTTLQERLERVITDGTLAPMGPDDADRYPLSTHIIASSRQDLRALSARGQFRAGLVHRLAVIEVLLPPLRERGADIGLLARHFLARMASENALQLRSLSAAALDRLSCLNWPGNVRELEDVVHRAALLGSGPEITPEQLVRADGTPLSANATSPTTPAGSVDALVGKSVAHVERDLILKTLERCRGNRTSASAILGISVRTMRNKLREFAAAGYGVR